MTPLVSIDAAASPYGVTSKHGPLEVEGDVQQLCIAKHWNQHSPSSSSLPLDSFEIQPLHSHTEAWRDAWKVCQTLGCTSARTDGASAYDDRCPFSSSSPVSAMRQSIVRAGRTARSVGAV